MTRSPPISWPPSEHESKPTGPRCITLRYAVDWLFTFGGIVIVRARGWIRAPIFGATVRDVPGYEL